MNCSKWRCRWVYSEAALHGRAKSLDRTAGTPDRVVIKTMRDTGRDMQDKYKETSRGGG